jgi:hypothetical protein
MHRLDQLSQIAVEFASNICRIGRKGSECLWVSAGVSRRAKVGSQAAGS